MGVLAERRSRTTYVAATRWGSSLTNASILIEIDAHVFLEPADDIAQQAGEPSDLSFEVLDACFERGGAFALLRDLALLIQVPEEAHGS